MDSRVTPRPQLPQTRELETPSPKVEHIELRSSASAPAVPAPRAPVPGSFKLGETGFYDLQVYPGPLLKVIAAWPAPAAVDIKV